ncbi:hypothetical protein [Terasakiella sp.]|uniref:hypothetical protein n=1 Tax=Terasakiella sp. TaxID=2034861 RepID=UPI003AA7B68E
MEGVERIWVSIPEWVRWVLCWPLLALIYVVAFLVMSFLSNQFFLLPFWPRGFVDGAVPMVSGLFALYIVLDVIGSVVPKKAHYLVIAVGLLGVFSLAATIFNLLIGLIADDWATVRDLAWSVLAISICAKKYRFVKCKQKVVN